MTQSKGMLFMIQDVCFNWPSQFSVTKRISAVNQTIQLFELMGIQKLIHGLKKIVAHCRLID